MSAASIPTTAEHLIAWLAHRVQRPHEKINHALVLGGPQGIGKDTLLEPVKHAVGPWNFTEVSPAAHARPLQRLRQERDPAHQRSARPRRRRPLRLLRSHEGLHRRAARRAARATRRTCASTACFNVCGVIMTTNHKTDGIYLPADDRRHYVAWSDLTKRRLFRRLLDAPLAAGTRAAAWATSPPILRELDLAGFDPKAPPRRRRRSGISWTPTARPKTPNWLTPWTAWVIRRLSRSLHVAGCPGGVTFGEWLRDRRTRDKCLIAWRRQATCPFETTVRGTDCGNSAAGDRWCTRARTCPLRDRLAAAGNLGGGR